MPAEPSPVSLTRYSMEGAFGSTTATWKLNPTPQIFDKPHSTRFLGRASTARQVSKIVVPTPLGLFEMKIGSSEKGKFPVLKGLPDDTTDGSLAAVTVSVNSS
jgi:hypothetical protein